MCNDNLESSSIELRVMVSDETLLNFQDGQYHSHFTLMPLINSYVLLSVRTTKYCIIIRILSKPTAELHYDLEGNSRGSGMP